MMLEKGLWSLCLGMALLSSVGLGLAQTYSMEGLTEKDRDRPGFDGPKQVSSLHELEQWAKSSEGGGTLRTFGDGDSQLYVVERMPLKEGLSSQISIFARVFGQIRLVFHISTQVDSYHRLLIHEGSLVILRGNLKREEIEVGSLSFASFRNGG